MTVSFITSLVRGWLNPKGAISSIEAKKKSLQQLSKLTKGAPEGAVPSAKELLEALQELAPQGPFVIPEPPTSCVAYQGGGARGVSFVGVSSSMEEHGITPKIHTVVGSSAGAITAFLFAIGCNAEQFKEFSDKLNMQDLLDAKSNYGAALWNAYVYSGKNFHDLARMVSQEMLGNADATLGDLHTAITDPKHPYHHPELKHLIVTATQLLEDGNAKTVVFSSRDPKTHKVKIADVIRASMSIPGLFQPWEIIDTDGNNWGLFFDGGILRNFPIDLLDRAEYAQTHLGIQYPLVEVESGADLYYTNPCSFGFTFVDDLQQLDPTITPLSERLASLCAEQKITLGTKPASPPLSSIGTQHVAHLVHIAFNGQRNPEPIIEKAKRHPGKIVQLYSEGIGLMNFAAEKGQIGRAELTANESTSLQFQQKDKTARYTGKKVEIIDLKLSRYLEALAIEVLPYKDEIDDKNCAIQFLAQKILARLAVKKEKHPYDTEEDILARKIEKFKQRRELLQNRDKRLQNVLNNQKIVEKLQSLMEQPTKEKNEQFRIHFAGNLTGVIELSFEPLQAHDKKNILQLAIYTGDHLLFEEMLKTVDGAYKHREEQKRAPKELQTMGDLINRASDGLLRIICKAPLDQKQKLQMLDVLLQYPDCNPLEEGSDGLTPLHLALQESKKEMSPALFHKLMERVVGGYFYRSSYRSSPDGKESLFEYILREADPTFLLQILDNETTRRKLFYYKQLCENGFSMQELLADYARRNPEHAIWKWCYDKKLVNDDYQTQVSAFDAKLHPR